MDELLQDMIDPAPPREEVERRRRLTSTFVILGLTAVGLTSLTTGAIFTDNETVRSNAITTGTVNLASMEDPVFSFDLATGVAPGDAVFSTVTVANSGSMQLRYAVGYLATPLDTEPGGAGFTPDTGTPAITSAELSDRLRLRVYAGLASCTAATTDAATPIGDTGPGGSYGLAATLADLVGDPATGPDTGDRVLNAVSGSETLCLRVDVDRDAGNEYQATSADITVRFDAEQVTNNP